MEEGRTYSAVIRWVSNNCKFGSILVVYHQYFIRVITAKLFYYEPITTHRLYYIGFYFNRKNQRRLST